MKRNTKEYKNFHARLSRNKGRATEYGCVDCGNMADEWSWTHGTDELDYENYQPRCRSCHAKYDKQIVHANNTGEQNWNACLTRQLVDEIKNKYGTGDFTHRQLAEEYGVSRSHIHRILTGKVWNSKESVL